MKKPRKARTPLRRKTAPVPEVALRRATITQTKNHLSALIDRVRHGDTITIVDRDQPVARLVPVVTADAADADERLQRLARAGLIRLGSGDLGALASGWK